MSMHFFCYAEDSKHNVCIEQTMCGKCLAAGPLCNWCSKEVVSCHFELNFFIIIE